MTKKLNLPDKEICKKYLSGMSAGKIAKDYECDSGIIINRLRNNNILIRNGLDLPTGEICEKYLNGNK